MKQTIIKILAISGSLRNNSSNGIIVKAVEKFAPENVEFTIYEGLGSLPHFNGEEDAPEPVKAFRRLLTEADGIFICTPEYAFGVPGVLKNALDWTVSSGAFVDKPVALVTASSSGKHAHASLLLTLTAISATITEDTMLLIPFIRSKLNEKGDITDSAVESELRAVLDALIEVIKSK